MSFYDRNALRVVGSFVWSFGRFQIFDEEDEDGVADDEDSPMTEEICSPPPLRSLAAAAAIQHEHPLRLPIILLRIFSYVSNFPDRLALCLTSIRAANCLLENSSRLSLFLRGLRGSRGQIGQYCPDTGYHSLGELCRDLFVPIQSFKHQGRSSGYTLDCELQNETGKITFREFRSTGYLGRSKSVLRVVVGQRIGQEREEREELFLFRVLEDSEEVKTSTGGRKRNSEMVGRVVRLLVRFQERKRAVKLDGVRFWSGYVPVPLVISHGTTEGNGDHQKSDHRGDLLDPFADDDSS